MVHELAHVRQQTGGAVSMLPQEHLELEIDPDPKLEEEAEEVAQRVMSGGELGIQRMQDTEVHVQRLKKGEMFNALALFQIENESDSVGSFQAAQNDRRYSFLRKEIEKHNATEGRLEEIETQQETQETYEHGDFDEDDLSPKGRKWIDKALPDRTEIGRAKKNLEAALQDKLDQVALTDDQRSKLRSGFETGLLADLSTSAAFDLVSLVFPRMAMFGSYVMDVISNKWGSLDGDIVKRAAAIKEEIEGEMTGEGDYSEKYGGN